jgi:hypothetical protein
MKKKVESSDARDTCDARPARGRRFSTAPEPETGATLSLDAHDLVYIAATLDPALCKSDPASAFREAIAFFHLATLFVEENKHWNPSELCLDQLGTGFRGPLVKALNEKARTLWGPANRQRIQSDGMLLLLRPNDKRDAVREFIEVKTVKAVEDRFREYFLAQAGQGLDAADSPEDILAEGNRRFERFWNKAKIEDDKQGNALCYGLHKRQLEIVQKWWQERRKETKRKSAAKARREKSSVQKRR